MDGPCEIQDGRGKGGPVGEVGGERDDLDASKEGPCATGSSLSKKKTGGNRGRKWGNPRAAGEGREGRTNNKQ